MVAHDPEEVGRPGSLGVSPLALIADRLQGALERVVGVRDGVLRFARAVAGMSAEEFFARAVEVRLMQVSKCRTDDLAVDQLRVHADDHAALELVPDPGAAEAFVEVSNRLGGLLVYPNISTVKVGESRYDPLDESKASFDEVQCLVYRRTLAKEVLAPVFVSLPISQFQSAMLLCHKVVDPHPPPIVTLANGPFPDMDDLYTEVAGEFVVGEDVRRAAFRETLPIRVEVMDRHLMVLSGGAGSRTRCLCRAAGRHYPVDLVSCPANTRR